MIEFSIRFIGEGHYLTATKCRCDRNPSVPLMITVRILRLTTLGFIEGGRNNPDIVKDVIVWPHDSS